MKFNLNNPFRKNKIQTVENKIKSKILFTEIENELINKEIKNNWDKNGSLGVTSQDHIIFGSTPDQILIDNPGKTLGELMSDSEIKDFIEGTLKNIEGNKNYENLNSFNKKLLANLILSVKYLKSIKKIPEDFILQDKL